jgi:transposase
VAPSRVPRPVTSGAKCDRLDCLKLAQFAARGMLRPIAVPTVDEEARRTLVRRRHDLVDAIRRVKQRIKSQLLFLGLPEPKEAKRWSPQAAEALRAIPMDTTAHMTLESHLRELNFHQNELRTVAEQLQQVVRASAQRQRVACLRSVPGVGPVVAATFVLEMYRPERFQRPEQVASYLGLAPVVRQSGGKSPSGRLVPVGQTRLRSLLVEAAWLWKAKDPYAATIYNRLLGRCGIAQKAITALARRLAILLWRLAIEQRPYRTMVLPIA